jgi:hypothetical protein
MRLEPSPSPANTNRSYLWKFNPARYKRAYLFGGVPEERVQADIRSALSYLHVDAAVVDAGFSAIRGKVWGAMKKLRLPEPVAMAIMNALKDVSAAPVGWSDLCGCLAPSGRAFYIEVKAPAKLDPVKGTIITRAGVPTREQLFFLDRMAARGALVGVAWSVEDALEILAPALAEHKASVRG